MSAFGMPRCGALLILFVFSLCGCSSKAPTEHPLNPELARTSLQKAMQAWVEGKTPDDLKPGIIMGDVAWKQGKKLSSFEIVASEETSDGSNLHIPVTRKFEGGEDPNAGTDAKVTYIVGTSPVVTIFPQ